MNEQKKSFKVYYEHGAVFGEEFSLRENWWKKRIDEVESPEEAYQKFLSQVGVWPLNVVVEMGFAKAPKVFTEHKKKGELEVNKIRELKRHTKQNKTINEPSKSFGINNLESNTDKLLAQIIEIQHKQFTILKRINFILLGFWLFFIVLPLLSWQLLK